ncbi:MAG TPA: Zn-dependent hydrolase, partial [Clostridiaceae bacterium]|nr:Zn-dependent hydrolase [Clostridiaceae bacterium]
MQNVIDYIELHIEQGRVLWEKGMDIGIVTSIAAPKRYRLNILGRQDHSGATPMYMRKDALCAAAEVISLVEELGKKESVHSTVATVGIIKEKPNVMNVVPGFVELGIDIRGIDKDSINRVLDGLKKDTDNIMKRRGIDYEFQKISSSDPVTLDRSVIESLKRAAKKLNIDFVEMPSGAGHDAMEMANITKAGMIFIPCKEGISHNIHEKADLDKVIEGSKIILEYLKEESL